ncbi:MAG: hypothetical protein M3004_13010, partial [Bacteroidota bacterium]|nr:hypothetical protein [Bacteroidota bacterium]
LNKYLKYTLKSFAVLLIILLATYIVVLLYVTVNKQKIIKQVTQEVGKKLSGNVSIQNVELSFFSHFPQVSVLLHNVTITDTMFAQHHHSFFQGEKVYVRLSIISLIRSRPAVNGFKLENGSFYLYTDTSGYTNRYLFKSKKDSIAAAEPAKGRNQLRTVALKNVRITLDDKQKNKLHDIVVNNLDMDLDDKDESSFLFSTKIDMLVHSLAFNLQNGSFIKEKTFSGNFDLRYDKKLKQLQFDSIDIKLGGQPFNLTARFDLEGPAPQFSLKAHTKNILYSFAKTILTPKISTALSIADLDKPIDISADLSGPLKEGDPLMVAKWSTKNTHLVTPFLDFANASFTGFYTNEVVPGQPRKDPNSKIVVTNFSATWQDLPITSNNIEIMNLLVPQLTCDLKSNFSLTTLNDIIGSNALQLRTGDCSANLTYKGPLAKNNNSNSFVNGLINIKNGEVLYAPTGVELKNVNGRIVFKNSDLFVENLQCDVLNNKIIMNGEAHNLLTLINTEPNHVNVNWSIYSPSLNLNAFTFLLKPRKKIAVAENKKRKLENMATKIDQVLEQGSLSVNLKAARLIYKKFEATNTLANISLLQDRYLINNVSMDHADGHMALKGSVIANRANNHQAKINVTLDNVDVSKVFTAFDNFGQDGITAQSLQGKLTAKIDASLDINDEGKADPASIESVVDFSLKNGALMNYEPIKKLQNFLFKNRDFENIRFAELKDRFEIKNQEVKINRMEIQSSVMSMFVEGVFSKKGNTDLSIQVPLSNIHKRGADFNPENIGADKKGGSSIHLRGRPGPDGNIKFKLDLFNKFKKDKDKSEVQ